MTFLALDLGAIPAEVGHPGGTSTLEYLHENIPDYGVYFGTFLVVGFLWWRHHLMFRFIKRSSGGLVWTNTLMLALVAMLPYPASVVSEAPGLGLALLMLLAPLTLIGLLMSPTVVFLSSILLAFLSRPGRCSGGCGVCAGRPPVGSHERAAAGGPRLNPPRRRSVSSSKSGSASTHPECSPTAEYSRIHLSTGIAGQQPRPAREAGLSLCSRRRFQVTRRGRLAPRGRGRYVCVVGSMWSRSPTSGSGTGFRAAPFSVRWRPRPSSLGPLRR